jgi:hypothetical protein
VTPLECSVVCHSSWAKNVVEPAIKCLSKAAAKAVSVSTDDYLVISVISAGMDAASRVMELTSPLALAGIPIFFIATYYSDFILVPKKAQHAVTQGPRECEDDGRFEPGCVDDGNGAPESSI